MSIRKTEVKLVVSDPADRDDWKPRHFEHMFNEMYGNLNGYACEVVSIEEVLGD